MWYPAELTFSNYIPLQPERGMFFLNKDNTLWELDFIPQDREQFFKLYGYPVELFVAENNNLLALPEEVGWITDDKDIWKIDIDDINYLLEECEGKIYIEIEDEGEDVVPLYKDNLVTIKPLE
ncbi:MAG TPA: hypothetical protein PLR64_03675 [Candidatus Dojkabacteria bacterium]|nr:hypothetical protein [Candidatus Dojkabacteria bacterium]